MSGPLMQDLFKAVLMGEVVQDETTGLWKGVCSIGSVVEDSSEFIQRSG